MKFNPKVFLAFAVLWDVSAEFNGDAAVGIAEDGAEATDNRYRAPGIEGDDAEFWDRFLGYYYYKKKKKMTPSPTELSLTDQPTQPPTEPPTSLPTSTPTQPPTQTPTQSPTKNPGCLVDVTVECVLADDGTPCEDVTEVDGTCAGGDINVVSFTYQPALCTEDENAQGSGAECIDVASFPDGNVTITCSDDSGTEALETSPSSVGRGDEFTVSRVGDGSGPLPDKIMCTFRDGQAVLQTNTIDTSGASRLDLKDSFGALQLESCDEQDCVKEVRLTYIITNIGMVNMNVTSVTGQVINTDMLNNDDVFELVDLVSPNPIPVGDSVPVEFLTDIDFCVGQVVTITGRATALPDGSPFPLPCVDSANTTFTTPILTDQPTTSPTQPPTQPPTQIPTQQPTSAPTQSPTTNPPCDITIDVVCTIEDPENAGERIPCRDAPVVDGVCAPGADIDAVSFTYQPGTCDESNNNQGTAATCMQMGVTPSREVRIMCTDDAGSVELATFPDSIEPGDEFTVTSLGGASMPLPDKIFCSIEEDMDVLQSNIIDVSGNERLDLKDTFGALQLEACNENDCVKDVTLTYTITNVGDVDMSVTSVIGQVINMDMVNNDAVFELVDMVMPNPVLVGQSVMVAFNSSIDFCVGELVTITGSTSALPEGSPFPLPCVDNTSITLLPPDLTDVPTQSPSASPSSSPSDTPTERPSESPSASPSASPSSSPSESPSKSPSATPTASPSSQPTASPSKLPSATPTASPSARPSSTPTASPSSEPTASPSESPTQSPTETPTQSPSNSPSSPPSLSPLECTLDLEVVPPRVNVTEDLLCDARPSVMRMFFDPLNCSEAERLQLACLGNDNTCQDVVPGWQRDFNYTQVWIRAYGVGRNPNVDGLLVTNERLTESDNGPYFEMRYKGVLVGTRLDSDQIIEVWNLGPDGNSRGNTLLQTVTFHASCSQPLLCLNSFGSSTLVTFTNTNQRQVECLDTLTVPLLVRFPLNIGGISDSFRITNALIRTDFTRPRVFNFGLDQVGNETYAPGDEVQFEIDAFLDVRREATLFTEVRIFIETAGTGGEPQECFIEADTTTAFEGIENANFTAACGDFVPIPPGSS